MPSYKKTLIILFILLNYFKSGCAKDLVIKSFMDYPCESILTEAVVDTQLRSFVVEFVYDTYIYNKTCLRLNLAAVVEDEQFSLLLKEQGVKSPTIVGFCDTFNQAIYIQRTFWEQSQLSTKKALVYHELGHCVLGLIHKPGVSIMNPSMMENYIYTNAWFPLVRDMFRQEPSLDLIFY